MGWQIVLNIDLFQAILTLIGLLLIYGFLQSLLEVLTKTPSEILRKGRRLGKLEACLDLLSQRREGTVNVCLIVSLKSKTKLLKEHVCDALLVLAKRQPLFRAVITSSPSGSTLAEERLLKIIDVDEIVHMINLKSVEVKAREWQNVWHEIATEQLGSGLLWQAVILQEEFLPESENWTNTIIFQMNPTCCDGTSSVKLCKQFLGYLNDVAQGSLTSDEDISSLSLLPSLWDLFKCGSPRSLYKFMVECSGFPRISKFVTKSMIRYLLSRKQINPYFAQFSPSIGVSGSTTPRSSLLYKVFSESQTLKIQNACKSKRSSVTGALTAATHMAFCKLVEERYSSGEDYQLEHWFYMNGRQNCYPNPPEAYLGQLAFLDVLKIPYTEADFWNIAQKYTKHIDNELKEEIPIIESMRLMNCFSAEEFVDQVLGPSDRQNLITMSSCNMICSASSSEFRKDEKHYTYKLQECLYNFPIHGLATTFGHFNATVNGKMSWVILYDSSRVKEADARKFSSLCFKYFLEIDR